MSFEPLLTNAFNCTQNLISFIINRVILKLKTGGKNIKEKLEIIMQKKKWISLLLAFTAWTVPLKGEIEEIIINWNAFKCQESCVAQIEQNFSAIKEVSNFKIHPDIGSATMKWSTTQQFSYEPFRYAAAAVGIRISTMRVRVKGTVAQDSQNMYIVSSGDGTRFQLIGPLQTEPGRYIPNYSLTTHPLTPHLREKLIKAERNKLTVVISGPLFLPSKYPQVLIAEQIKVNANEIREKRLL